MSTDVQTRPIDLDAEADPLAEPHAGASRFLQAALACGVIPLLAGAGLLAIYAKTYAAWVPDAELALLVCAPGFFLAGGACLSLANARHRSARLGPTNPRFESRFWRRVVLLLVNIPAIIAGGFAFSMLENRTVIVIVNASGEVLDECNIVAFDSVSSKTDLHPHVPAGGQVRSEFNLDDEGTVRVMIFQRNAKAEFDIATSNRVGVKQRVRVAPGLTHEVEPW